MNDLDLEEGEVLLFPNECFLTGLTGAAHNQSVADGSVIHFSSFSSSTKE